MYLINLRLEKDDKNISQPASKYIMFSKSPQRPLNASLATVDFHAYHPYPEVLVMPSFGYHSLRYGAITSISD